jgi:hypothetical protein
VGKHRTALLVQLGELCNDTYPRASAAGERVKAAEKERMKADMAKMKVVARAKVTMDRIYSMAYHPEKVCFDVLWESLANSGDRPRIFYFLATSMDNWGFGTLEPLQRMRMRMRIKRRKRMASIGDCSYIGLRPPRALSAMSSSIQ